MSQLSVTQYLRRRIELTIAFVLMLLLVAAGALLGAGSGSRAPRFHYLGEHGMELAALSGKLALTMTVTSPPTGSSTSPTSTKMPIRTLEFGIAAASNTGTSAGAGKTTLSEIKIVRLVDKSSPALYSAVATGKSYQSVLVTAARVSSGKVVEELKVLFKPAAVSSDQFSVSPAGAMEAIQLSAEGVTLQYSRPS